MKNSTPKQLVLAAALTFATAFVIKAGTQTLYYPTQDDAMFSIVAPSDWKVTAIEEVGDFASLESPNGNILQFRAQKFDTTDEAKKEVEAIFDDTAKFLDETYKEVKLNEPEEIKGDNPGAALSGVGKDKDGNQYEFLSAMMAIDDTTVAEIWGAVSPDDKEEMEAAKKILGSFKGIAKKSSSKTSKDE